MMPPILLTEYRIKIQINCYDYPLVFIGEFCEYGPDDHMPANRWTMAAVPPQ